MRQDLEAWGGNSGWHCNGGLWHIVIQEWLAGWRRRKDGLEGWLG